MIWTGGYYGHVALAISDTQIVEQNNPDGNYVCVKNNMRYNSQNYWGVWRPNWPNPDPIGAPIPDSPRVISDGDYHIVSALGGGSFTIPGQFCLTIGGLPAAKDNSGANAELWSVFGWEDHVFTVTYHDMGNYAGYYTIKLKNSANQYLDVPGATTVWKDANVQQWEGNNSDAQKWIIKETGNGAGYTIQAKCNGWYVDVAGGYTSNGTNIGLYTGNGTDAQKWYFVPWKGGQEIPDGEYQIVPRMDNNKALDAQYGGTEDGTNIWLYSNIGDERQTFDVTWLGNGYYKIINRYSNLALDVDGGGSKNVHLWSQALHQYNQQWIIRSCGDGYYNIISRCNGLYLDLAGEKTDNETNIQVFTGWGRDGGNGQKWKFIPFHRHDYGDEWVKNETGHWKECSCGDKQDMAAHEDGDGDGRCDECGYEIGGSGDEINGGGVLPGDMPDDDNIPDGIWITGVTEDGYAYTGSAIKPEVRVYDHKTLLKEKTDYTIAYKNNTKSNDASVENKAPTITVTGRGNYSGRDTKTFKILAPDISEGSKDGIFEADDIAVVYNKKAQKPAPVLYWNGKKLKNKTDYTYTCHTGTYEGTDTEETASVKETGDYYIKLTGVGNFTGTRRIQLKVLDGASLKLISKATVKKIANQSYQTQYAEGGITPELTVKYGSETLTEGTHYTVSYSNNTKVGTAYAVIKGIEGNGYSGTRRVSFKITGIAVGKAAVKGLGGQTFLYSGVDIKPDLTLTIKINGQERTLVQGTDYNITWQNNQNAGTAAAVITGLGGYTGTARKTFKIKAFDVKANAEGRFSAVLENDTVPYAKGGAKPALKVTFTREDGTVQTLAEGNDYTLTYKNHTAVNDGSNEKKLPTVTIRGKGSFSGIYDTKPTYKIIAQDIGKLALSAADKTYQNRKNIYATKVTITDLDGKNLKVGTDYDKIFTYTYKSDTMLADETVRAAGTVVDKTDVIPAGTVIEVEVSSKGNYVGTIKGEYRITQANISGTSVSIPKQTYTGQAITLSEDQITVKVKGKNLDTDQYEIVTGSYKNNVKKGTASVTLKGIDNYGGTKTVRFTIQTKGFLWWWKN